MNADFSPFPPYLYAVQVLDYIPSAASTYFMLWKDFFDLPPNQIRMTYDRKTIEQDRYLRWIKFTNDLNLLGRLGLLERAFLDDDIISVELAEWHEG